MKRIGSLVLALLMLLCLTGCQSGGNQAELEAAKVQVQLLQQQLDEANAALAEAEKGDDTATVQIAEPEAAPAPEMFQIAAVNARINGEQRAAIHVGETAELTAEAVIPEGMALDYWALNGERLAEQTGASCTFTAQDNAVIEAVLRPVKTVTAINATMQFLNAKDKAGGDPFTEFVFEEDYVNPVTGETVPGGTITVYVEADVPRGYEVDYWLINHVPYYYNRTVTSFRVDDLDASTEYEVVLKKKGEASSTPKPATQPNTTPAPTEEPVYYNVSCIGCTFSGGGYSGATGGKVPAGTVIKVTTTYSTDYTLYWRGSITDGSNSTGGGARSHTYTVNGDCNFHCMAVIN